MRGFLESLSMYVAHIHMTEHQDEKKKDAYYDDETMSWSVFSYEARYP